MAKNLNKVRTIKPISRSVTFKNVTEAAKFINLYKDLFYKAKYTPREETGFTISRFLEEVTVSFTIKKSDWVEIEKNLNLRQEGTGHYGRIHFVYDD